MSYTTKNIESKQLDLLFELASRTPLDQIIPCKGNQPDPGSVHALRGILEGMDEIRSIPPDDLKSLQDQKEWAKKEGVSTFGFPLFGGVLKLNNRQRRTMQGMMKRFPRLVSGQGMMLWSGLCRQLGLTEWYRRAFEVKEIVDDDDNDDVLFDGEKEMEGGTEDKIDRPDESDEP